MLPVGLHNYSPERRAYTWVFYVLRDRCFAEGVMREMTNLGRGLRVPGGVPGEEGKASHEGREGRKGGEEGVAHETRETHERGPAVLTIGAKGSLWPDGRKT